MNKPKVVQRGRYWQVVVSYPGRYASTTVDDWDEAIRIAIKCEGDPMKLMNIGILRQLGKRLDRDFQV